MEVFEPCINCKHQLLFGCKAFPDGIPDNYAQGIKIHTKIVKNQLGKFVFEQGLSDIEIEMKNIQSIKMSNYIHEYLEKHPREYQTVMSGVYSFGDAEMEEILKEALSQNKRFYLKNDFEKLDLATYKLIKFRKI
jgi:hypothetical protein